MDRAFNQMKKLLDKELGLGKPVPNFSSGEAHGYKRDSRERGVRWPVEGYTLELGLGAEEFGWDVQLIAFYGT